MMDIVFSVGFAATLFVVLAGLVATALLHSLGHINVRALLSTVNRVVIGTGILGAFLIITLVGLQQASGYGPMLPEWGQALVIYGGLWFIVALVPLEVFRQAITDRNKTELHKTDPEGGDYGTHKLSRSDWKNATVEDRHGNELNRSALVPVTSESGREAYECVDYRPKENTIIATWLADKTPTEVRAYESAIQDILDDSYKLTMAAVDVVARRESIGRDAALEEIRRNIEMRENTMMESSMPDTGIDEILQGDTLEELENRLNQSDFDRRDLSGEER